MKRPGNIDFRNSDWWILVPAICALALSAFLFHLARDRAAWESANRWLWQPQWPVFRDLDVTLEHLREAEQGLDPLSDPASDFAYPRAVLLLRYLQVQKLPSASLGAIQALVFMASVILILRPRTWGRALLAIAIFISPPVWLGLERGNIDLLLFVICCAAAAIWARAGTLPRLFAASAVMLAAALLKLYPAFALIGGAWAERSRRQLPWIVAIVFLAGFWFTHLDELRLIQGKFPVGGNGAWGCFIALKKIPDMFIGRASFDLLHLWLIALGIYAVAFAAVAWLGNRFAFKFRTTPTDRTEWAAFVLGTAICGGSFLASNYPYRWALALLTVPMLLRLAQASRFMPALWARSTLVALALSLAAPADGLRVFFFAQVANWAFILLTVGGFFAMRTQHLAPVSTAVRRNPFRRWIWPAPVEDDGVRAKTPTLT